MANKIMKTLTIGGNTYEIVDEAARADIEILKQDSGTVDIVEVDATLSIEGKAADAKATGDAIDAISATVSTHINNAMNKEDYYGLVEKEGTIITAKSLNGAGIKATTYIEATQEGEGDASPDNIRIVGGWDALTITRCGKNIFDANNYVKVKVVISNAGFSSTLNRSVVVNIKPNTTYTVKKDTATVMRIATSVKYPAIGDDYTERAQHTTASNAPLTVTSGDNDKYLTIQLFTNDDVGGDYASIDANVSTLQVEEGVVATTYEPYNATTLVAKLPETIYGGYIDWSTGILTATHYKRTFTGDENWKYQDITDDDKCLFECEWNDFIHKGELNESIFDVICSHNVVAEQANVLGIWLAKSSVDTTAFRWCCYDTDYADINTFQEFVKAQYDAGTPIEIVYKLETPILYQLTAQQLEALQGVNTVWSDCGDTRALFNYSLCGNYADVVSDPVKERENLLIIVSDTEPASPVTGMIWFDIS